MVYLRGFMIKERILMPIVDDAGCHSASDRGTVHAAEQGLVTGVDIMANESGAGKVIKTLQAQAPEVSLGSHVNMFPGRAQRAHGRQTESFRIGPDEDSIRVFVAPSPTTITS